MTTLKSIELTAFQLNDQLHGNDKIRRGRWNEYSNVNKDDREELYNTTIRDIILDDGRWYGNDKAQDDGIYKVSFFWHINFDRIHGRQHGDELQACSTLTFVRDLACVEIKLLTVTAAPVVTYYFRTRGEDTRNLTPADLERCVKKAYKLYTETDMSFPMKDEESKGE